MYSWELLYKENSLLDDIYRNKYLGNTDLYYEKNCIALLVELGEFANETKEFKYWSIKEANKEAALEELADCLMLSLQFLHYFNLELLDLPVAKPFSESLLLLNELFLMTSFLIHDTSDMLVLQIFVSLIELGRLTGFSEEEMIKSCYKKIEKCKDRFKTDY